MITMIIVDYHSMGKTLHYIDQYIAQCLTDKDSDIESDAEKLHMVIVDNAPDKSKGLQQLRERFGDEDILPGEVKGKEVYRFACQDTVILYVSSGENLGYAKGNNLGAAVAKACFRDEYYLFSNNDMVFPGRLSMQKLMEPMQNPGVAVTGPMICDPQGEQQSPRKKVGAFSQLVLYYWDLLLPKGCKMTRWITDVEAAGECKSCYWVTGSFMLVRAAAFWKVEGFDPHTFLFCEEVILSEKLRRLHYETWFQPQVRVIHEHGQTVKKAFDVMRQIEISFQSNLYYYTEYRGLSKGMRQIALVNFSIFQKLFLLKKKLKRWRLE